MYLNRLVLTVLALGAFAAAAPIIDLDPVVERSADANAKSVADGIERALRLRDAENSGADGIERALRLRDAENSGADGIERALKGRGASNSAADNIERAL